VLLEQHYKHVFAKLAYIDSLQEFEKESEEDGRCQSFWSNPTLPERLSAWSGASILSRSGAVTYPCVPGLYFCTYHSKIMLYSGAVCQWHHPSIGIKRRMRDCRRFTDLPGLKDRLFDQYVTYPATGFLQLIFWGLLQL